MSPDPARAAPWRLSASTPFPPASVDRRRAALVGGLLALLLAFSWVAPPASAEAPRWRWPLSPPHEVLAPFEAPAHHYGPGHRGVDLAVPGPGTEVRAVEAGTVRFSGEVAGRGVVSVTHADGLISTYEPVSGVLEKGAAVETGTVLGMTESSPEVDHCPEAACLHLGARRGEDYLDPMLLLGARGPSVLLPWAGRSVDGAPSGAGAGEARAAPEHGGAVRASPAGGADPSGAPSGLLLVAAPGAAAGMRATLE